MYFKDLSYIFDIYSYFFWKEYEGRGICLIFIICIDNMLVFVVLRRYLIVVFIKWIVCIIMIMIFISCIRFLIGCWFRFVYVYFFLYDVVF